MPTITVNPSILAKSPHQPPPPEKMYRTFREYVPTPGCECVVAPIPILVTIWLVLWISVVFHCCCHDLTKAFTEQPGHNDTLVLLTSLCLYRAGDLFWSLWTRSCVKKNSVSEFLSTEAERSPSVSTFMLCVRVHVLLSSICDKWQSGAFAEIARNSSVSYKQGRCAAGFFGLLV